MTYIYLKKKKVIFKSKSKHSPEDSGELHCDLFLGLSLVTIRDFYDRFSKIQGSLTPDLERARFAQGSYQNFKILLEELGSAINELIHSGVVFQGEYRDKPAQK